MFKTRFISMLVLLAAVATGAWAQTETLLITINSVGHGEAEGDGFISGSRTFNNIATVTFSSEVENDDDNDGWYNSGWDNKILSVAPAAGYTITKVKFYNQSGSAFDETSPFEATLYAMKMYVNGSSCGAGGVTKIDVYGYVTPATVAVTGVTLAPTSATLTLGETETVTLTATVLPGDATDKSVTWSSSNEAVATVADGVVTAVAAGEATITVTTTDGAKTATCAVTVAAPAASTYTVTLKEGTEDATSWTIAPAEATTTGVAAGTEVKATYGGTKKVKSVKAKKMSPIISLSDRSKLDDELVIADGYIVTGSAVAYSCKVAVADGATVTLRDVENTGYIDGGSTTCPGIRCIGDATIILEGNNTVTGGDTYAGIYVPEGKTLTIRGTGSLTVTGGISGAGIGGNNGGNCGSIVISGGTITATGGSGGAGIGLGYSSGCEFGDITISGGTVTATGSGDAPGIGGPYAYFKNITITDDVTKVTVNKGSNSTYSIGTSESDDMEYCGAITIGGMVYLNGGYFDNDGDSYLRTSPLVYQP